MLKPGFRQRAAGFSPRGSAQASSCGSPIERFFLGHFPVVILAGLAFSGTPTQENPYTLEMFSANGGGLRSMSAHYKIAASTSQQGGIGPLTSTHYELADGFWHLGSTGAIRPYGDVFPAGGNGIVDVDDLLYVLNSFADPAMFPEGDIEPCGGDGDVDVDDILAELDAFSGVYACPHPCPP